MFHLIKRTGLVLALVLAAGQSVFGFAMLGPFNEGYQTQAIGYNLSGNMLGLGDDGGNADLGGPKNIGQGYRWNTPTNYYVYDIYFERYFGTAGASNIDAAFNMYNSLGKLSANNVNQWPLTNPTGRNSRAKALELIDLKSTMMSVLIEQLGLAQPDRWTWCLHDRYVPGNAKCPNYEYLVIQRNYDPQTYVYSSYVNDVFYDFYVYDLCSLNPNGFAPLLADAIEESPDPAVQQDEVSSVAAYGSSYAYGSFFLTFTRDDIGGLQYLYSPTNIYPELAESNSVQVIVNTQNVDLITTYDLATFEQIALTNDGPTLEGLYPGLVVTSDSRNYGIVITTNYYAYLTNPPFAPAGTFEVLLATNYTTNVQTIYSHTYGNMVIDNYYTRGFVTQVTAGFQPVPFAPAGTYQFETNAKTTVANFVNGDFYIIPTNLCGAGYINVHPFPQLPYTVESNITILPLFTNIFVTNSGPTTNFLSYMVTYFTNWHLLGNEVDCNTTNVATTRGGMDEFNFVRVPDNNYDSLTGRFYTPITNFYQLIGMTNGVPTVQNFQRILNGPDILVTGADLTTGPQNVPVINGVGRSVPNFVTALVPANQGGPGTIESTGIKITFNTVGPVLFNSGLGSFFLLDGFEINPGTNFAQYFMWGSYDATTNAPIVYPDPNSLADYEQQLFYQITTGLLPDPSVSANNVSNPYSYQLTASSSLTNPLKWALATNSPGLPPGINLSSGGVLSGSPTSTGTYDFIVQATDSSGHVARKAMSLQINP